MPSPEALITCEWCGTHLGEVDDATTLGRLRELVASHRCLFPYDQLWLRVESGTISQRIWQDRRRAADLAIDVRPTIPDRQHPIGE